MSKRISQKEKEFADKLSSYENKWIAISRTATKEEIVASGDRFKDAKKAADAKGVKNAVYRKIPSSNKILIA